MKRFGQLVYGIALVGVMAFSGGSAAAQETETTQLLVQSMYCADNTGFASGDCSPASGVSATAELTGGAVLGSCVTESGMIRDAAVGYCYIEVPYNIDVVVTQNDATLSQGYVSTNNPQQVVVRGSTDETPDYIPTALFINAPAEEAPAPAPVAPAPEEPAVEAPVSNLPKTGVRSVSNETRFSMMMAMATGSVMMLAVAARRFQAEDR